MQLDDIIALAERDATKAWGPVNSWLAKNFVRASDRDLARALRVQRQLSNHIAH